MATLFERIMRVMSVKLNFAILLLVEEQWLRWKTYANLLMWFIKYWAVLQE